MMEQLSAPWLSYTTFHRAATVQTQIFAKTLDNKTITIEHFPLRDSGLDIAARISDKTKAPVSRLNHSGKEVDLNSRCQLETQSTVHVLPRMIGGAPGKRGGRRRHSGRTMRMPSPTHAMSRETAMIVIQSAVRQTLARMLVTSRRDELASSPDVMPLTSIRPNALTSSTPPDAPARPSSKSPFDASVLSSLSPFQRKIRVVAAVSLQAATRCFSPRTLFLRQRAAATKLQTSMRRRSCYLAFVRQRVAAMRLQASARRLSNRSDATQLVDTADGSDSETLDGKSLYGDPHATHSTAQSPAPRPPSVSVGVQVESAQLPSIEDRLMARLDQLAHGHDQLVARMSSAADVETRLMTHLDQLTGMHDQLMMRMDSAASTEDRLVDRVTQRISSSENQLTAHLDRLESSTHRLESRVGQAAAMPDRLHARVDHMNDELLKQLDKIHRSVARLTSEESSLRLTGQIQSAIKEATTRLQRSLDRSHSRLPDSSRTSGRDRPSVSASPLPSPLPDVQLQRQTPRSGRDAQPRRGAVSLSSLSPDVQFQQQTTWSERDAQLRLEAISLSPSSTDVEFPRPTTQHDSSVLLSKLSAVMDRLNSVERQVNRNDTTLSDLSRSLDQRLKDLQGHGESLTRSLRHDINVVREDLTQTISEELQRFNEQVCEAELRRYDTSAGSSHDISASEALAMIDELAAEMRRFDDAMTLMATPHFDAHLFGNLRRVIDLRRLRQDENARLRQCGLPPAPPRTPDMSTTTRPYPALSALFGTPPEVFTRRSGVRYSTHPSGTLEMS